MKRRAVAALRGSPLRSTSLGDAAAFCALCLPLTGLARGGEFLPGLGARIPPHKARAAASLSGVIQQSGLDPKSPSWPVLLKQRAFHAQGRGLPFPRVALGTFAPSFAEPTEGSPDAVRLTADSWVARTYEYTYRGASARPSRFLLTVSRLTPAILLENPDSAHWELSGLPGKAAPKYAAYPSRGGVRVRSAPAEIDGSELSGRWIYLYYGDRSPYITLTSSRRRKEQGDYPLLLVLQRRPKTIRLSPSGAAIDFPAKGGAICAVPAPGMRELPSAETETWKDSFPGELVKTAELFSQALRRFPVAVEESYRLDRAGGVVIRTTFQFKDLPGDWGGKEGELSPLAPVFGMAMKTGFPLEVSRPTRELIALDLFGPCLVVEAKNEYTVTVPDVMKYLDEELVPRTFDPAQAPELVGRLTAEVETMLAAGHLQPAHFAGGLQDFQFGMRYFFGSPAELVYTLCQTLPFLPGKTRARVLKYMEEENERYPVLAIKNVGFGDGAPRDFFTVPTERSRHVPPLPKRPIRGAPFHSLYSAWYLNRTAGEELCDVDVGIKKVLDACDWATGGLAYTPFRDWGFKYLGGAFEETGAHTINEVLAGLIGWGRLKRSNRDFAAYLMTRFLLARHNMTMYPEYLARSADERTKALLPLSDRALHVTHMTDSTLNWTRGPKSVFTTTTACEYLCLVPEVGRFVGEHCREKVAKDIAFWNRYMPYWFVARTAEVSGENYPAPLDTYWGQFQARAYILQQDWRELEGFLDVPAALGDLYYLQNLVATLRARAGYTWARVGPAPD